MPYTKGGKGMYETVWMTVQKDGSSGPMIMQGDPEVALHVAQALDLDIVGEVLDKMPVKSLAIKDLTEDTVTIGGYGILFGNPTDRDLEGDYFTKATDLWLEDMGSSKPVMFEHGFGDLGRAKLGKTTEWEQDEIGWWVESQLSRHNQYIEHVLALASQGVLGYSSGAVGHLSERASNGEIKSWPVAEMSLTVEPAEPRLLGLKELKDLGLIIGDQRAETAANAVPQVVVNAETVSISSGSKGTGMNLNVNSGGIEMDEAKNKDKDKTILSPETEEIAAKVYDKISVDITAKLEEVMDQAIKQLDKVGPKPSHLVENDDVNETKSFGDFLLAIRGADHKRLREVYKARQAKDGEFKTAMAEGAGTTGGYMVPDEFRPELLSLAAEASVVRPRATVIPMRRRTMKIPALDVETAPSAGETQFFGGVASAWTEEAGTLSESEPAFREVELVAHKLAGYSLVSNELLDDSAIALERLLYALFGGAIGWYEDYAFLRGNGVGKPLGIATWCVNNISNVGVTKTAASDFRTPDVLSMFQKLLPQSYSRAVWIMHVSFIAKLYGMSSRDASGGTAADSMFVMLGGGAQDFSSMLPATLLGRPVIISEKLPAINTDGSVLLADLSMYLVGDREDVAIDFSEHYRFINDQATWRFLKRVDGQPWLKDAVTISDGSTKLSPFVTVNY